MNQFQLTDEQWTLVEPLFTNASPQLCGSAYLPWRMILNSILLVLTAKTKWSNIPKEPEYAAKSVAHWWYLKWIESGFLMELLEKIPLPEVRFPPRRNRGSNEFRRIKSYSQRKPRSSEQVAI
jgi:transposase